MKNLKKLLCGDRKSQPRVHSALDESGKFHHTALVTQHHVYSTFGS